MKPDALSTQKTIKMCEAYFELFESLNSEDWEEWCLVRDIYFRFQERYREQRKRELRLGLIQGDRKERE